MIAEMGYVVEGNVETAEHGGIMRGSISSTREGMDRRILRCSCLHETPPSSPVC
jgi:hypothetical protein